MKSLVIVTSLLAAATVVRGQDFNIVEKYLEYLMPYVKPCAEENSVTTAEMTNVQSVPKDADLTKLGCLRACVMKRMDVLHDGKVDTAPINKMIEVVHAGDDKEIEKVKKIASDCISDLGSETDDCKIGLQYTDCYLHKLMGQ